MAGIFLSRGWHVAYEANDITFFCQYVGASYYRENH